MTSLRSSKEDDKKKNEVEIPPVKVLKDIRFIIDNKIVLVSG